MLEILWESVWLEIGIASALFATLLAVLEISYRLGRKSVREGERNLAQLGTIQGAVLGLLGLLLGFSFAGAAGRFEKRQDFVVQEANAIGTAYLRADLLNDPYRQQLRDALKEYVSARISAFQTLSHAKSEELHRHSLSLHGRIWTATEAGVRAAPEYNVSVLGPVNEVIDLHASGLDASQRHLPLTVTALLVVCSLVAMIAIGYGCGVTGNRNHVLTLTLGFLVSAVLWATIDLDYPRRGLIRVDQQPLLDLAHQVAAPSGEP